MVERCEERDVFSAHVSHSQSVREPLPLDCEHNKSFPSSPPVGGTEWPDWKAAG